MPTPAAALRPRLASVLALLSLTLSLPALADDFQGADAVLRRLSEDSQALAANPDAGQLAQLKNQIAAYRKDAAKLAPDVAATRWLALLDTFTRLPQDEVSRQPYQDRVDIDALLAALPPPASWDALASAINARTAKAIAPRELSLRVLGSVLAGDSAAQTAALERIRTVVKADKKLEDYELNSLLESIDKAAEAIAASAGDSARLAAFERALVKAEAAGSAPSHYRSSYLPIPDLVRYGGRAAADPLLLRALKLDVDLQLWRAGEHTRRALSELSLKHVDQLKRPQWELVSSLEDVALYEALDKKFPAKGAAADNERRSATIVYLFGLVAAGRTADATALVFDPDARFGRHGLGYSFGHGGDEIFTQLQRAGRGDAVVDFLHSVLQRDPALPFWDAYIAISAQQSRAKEALAFLRTILAKPGLPAADAAMLRQRYAAALLSADEVDEGLSVLRALIAEDRRAAAAVPAPAAATVPGAIYEPTGTSTVTGPDGAVVATTTASSISDLKTLGVDMPPEVLAALQAGQADTDFVGRGEASRNESDARADRITKLLQLGRLLEKPELVDEALAAGHDLIPRFTKNDAYRRGSLVEAMVEALEKSGRAAEAEALLVDHLTKLGQEEKGGYRGQTQTALLQLSGVYGRAGRHADVLRLLTGSPDLGASDLEEIPMSGCSSTEVSTHLLIVDALLAAKRNDEARRILRRIVQNQPGCDAAYERLEKLGGPDYAALLDEAARLDRFEERPLIWKARLQLAAGDLAAAEKTARAAIAIDPSDGEQGKGDRLRAYAVLGDILEKRGDAAQAAIMRGAVAAIRLSENADDWWTAGLLTRAVGLYEKSLLKFADAYCIQSRLALRYNELGDFAKAEEHYRRAFELMPESFGRVESHCFGCEGAFSGARAQDIADKVFTRLAAEPSPRAQVFYLLGYLRSSQERFDEAAEGFRKAVARDPDYLNAWQKLQGLAGVVHLPEAEREAATLAILRLDPESKHASLDLDGVGDLRKLWGALLAAEASIPAKEKGPLFEFPASKAKREEEAKKSDEFPHFSGFSGDAGTDPRTHLRQHDLVSAVAQLLSQTIER